MKAFTLLSRVNEHCTAEANGFDVNGCVTAGTSLRDCARILAEECRRRVIIVDTSNEIGGDGDIPHPSIASARRMQVGCLPVARPQNQSTTGQVARIGAP